MDKGTGTRTGRGLTTLGGAAVAATLLAAFVGSASAGASTVAGSSAPTAHLVASTAPGVTSTEIKVGTISTLSGAIASDFNAFTPGMEAYFDMVNKAGGVNGRKFEVAYNLDDGGNPSTFSQLAHTLIQQDHVFAVGASTYFFTPNLFVQTGTPTYGYNVTGDWAGPLNLFAAGGSTQNYSTDAAPVAYAVKETKSTSVAVISYGSGVTSSYNACHTTAQRFQAAGIKVSYEDLSAALGGDYTSAVQQMQAHGTNFILSCMQASDNISLARAVQQYGLKVHQLWLDGYDQSLLNQYSSLLQGVLINPNGNVPFEAVSSYPGHYPGVQAYLTTMQKYEPKFVDAAEALQGWESGALIVAGVKAAGNNLTQANVINKTNQITDFTADGITTATNWENAHTTTTYPGCTSFVQVKGTKFVPALNKAPQVFDCFAKNVNLKNPVTVPAPAGTPGT